MSLESLPASPRKIERTLVRDILANNIEPVIRAPRKEPPPFDIRRPTPDWPGEKPEKGEPPLWRKREEPYKGPLLPPGPLN